MSRLSSLVFPLGAGLSCSYECQWPRFHVFNHSWKTICHLSFLWSKANFFPNSILFYSSVGSFLIHHVMFYYVETFPNKWIVYGCLTTSVWNHGTTSRLAQISDRLWVAGCVGHNLLWLQRINQMNKYWYGTLFFTNTGVMFYFFSKFTKKYQLPFHFASHVLGTLSSLSLSMIFQKVHYNNTS